MPVRGPSTPRDPRHYRHLPLLSCEDDPSASMRPVFWALEPMPQGIPLRGAFGRACLRPVPSLAISHVLRRRPALWRRLQRHRPTLRPSPEHGAFRNRYGYFPFLQARADA
jgi:hypothetical protein